MKREPLPVPPLSSFRGLDGPDSLALSRGEVSRFKVQCDGILTGLDRDEDDDPLTPEDVQRVAVRLTWAFYYARKGAVPEQHDKLLLVWLGAIERTHDSWLDVEKPTLVKEKVVTVPTPSHDRQDAPLTMPRDPEQATIVLSPGDV